MSPKEFERYTTESPTLIRTANMISLTYGYALGKGISPTEAYSLSCYIRYQTELG